MCTLFLNEFCPLASLYEAHHFAETLMLLRPSSQASLSEILAVQSCQSLGTFTSLQNRVPIITRSSTCRTQITLPVGMNNQPTMSRISLNSVKEFTAPSEKSRSQILHLYLMLIKQTALVNGRQVGLLDIVQLRIATSFASKVLLLGATTREISGL